MSRANQVKNRAPAPIQISAEQLLREAKDRRIEEAPRAPKQYIADREELMHYRQTKRKDYEDQIRRQRHHIGTWCKYALWEASQKEFERARSIFERAIDVDHRNATIWFKYAEMEMKHKFINHARNIFDRAVAILPGVDNFWYKYSYMEEMVGAIEQARQIFERWMKWEPDDMAWSAYIKFEMRQGQIDRARAIYHRYIACHTTPRAYLKYARWEERQNEKQLAREAYETALEVLPAENISANFIIQFAKFEERCKEFERVRVIYKYALDNNIGDDSNTIKSEFIVFEKRYGDKASIENAIITKRRQQYKNQLADNAYDYDIWFDYCQLEEVEGDVLSTREVYEEAIANVPPLLEKKYWKRYVYLWIAYAMYEELNCNSIATAREVYARLLKLIPHKQFTFGKVWRLAMELEVRVKDLTAARKLMGTAIGLCGKPNIFKHYVNFELQLGEIDRCRNIYTSYLQRMPYSSEAWIAYAELEVMVGEIPRAREIYNIAIEQPELDMPEALWKSYIDMEISQQESENVRNLYHLLLQRTNHVKVWCSFIKFEASECGGGVEVVRKVAQEGLAALKRDGLKEERVILLDTWKELEVQLDGSPALVDKVYPRRVAMKRMITGSNGEDVGWEEYYDYQFPDEEGSAGLKILENAMKWKQMMASKGESVLGKRGVDEIEQE